MEPISLYIHIPFCRQRCSYCDFVTTAGRLGRMDDYIKAVCREVEQICQSGTGQLQVKTIFFGGGTPSLVSLKQYESLFAAFECCFDVDKNAEISLETNPGTLTLPYLQGLRQVGFNRISIGAQSVHADELALLQRIHNAHQIYQAVEWSRSAGFDNLNLDLMFGLPNQTLEKWNETLDQITALRPEHLSLYGLTIEEGTPLARSIQDGVVLMPDDDLAAAMYELAGDVLEKRGYQQYEISNWAVERAGQMLSCRHNLQYWHNLPYLGLGAGAHGYLTGCRLENTPDMDGYIQLFETGWTGAFPQTRATVETTTITRWDEIQETMMLGLRLTQEGVSEQGFFERFNRNMEDVFAREIKRLTTQGLLEWHQNEKGRCLRLTHRGRILGNQVFMAFVGLAER
jgi:oxygen-independent coproporphyrinogen III oxidase